MHNISNYTGFDIELDIKDSNEVYKYYHITPNYSTIQTPFIEIFNIIVLDTYNFNYSRISTSSFICNRVLDDNYVNHNIEEYPSLHIDTDMNNKYANIHIYANNISVGITANTRHQINHIIPIEYYTPQKLYDILREIYE